MTKIKVELIPEPDMCIFFEKGTRSGFSCVSNRYRKVNNKYLYDPKEESIHIYLDANNLNGCAVFKFLITSEYMWIDPKESDLNKYTSNSSKGCILAFDLEYPKEL